MAKNLPIQLVQFRQDKDEFKTEGIGGDALPRWVSADAISRNGSKLYKELGQLGSEFNNRGDNEGLPILIKAKINEAATAKSYRWSIQSIFESDEKKNVIGLQDIDQLLVKIDSSRDLDVIKRKASKYSNSNLSKSKKIAFSAIEGVERFRPTIEENLIGQNVKVKLVDYNEYALNVLRDTKFDTLCANLNIERRKLNYADDLTIYQIANISSSALSKLSTMDSVISIRKMPYVEITDSEEPEIADVIEKHAKEKEDYPVVGLLDSGIADINHLHDWILSDEEQYGNFVEQDIDRSHGTAVASTLAYGPELLGKTNRNVPFFIKDCIINIQGGVSEGELIENIRQYVEAHPEIKVWNLSQGIGLPIEDEKFSDFAIFLDDLQRVYDIIICKSTGNINPNSPVRRLNQGADSIRSIVVGSLDSHRSSNQDKVSTFSKVGPGPESTIKPDLVSYGGCVPVFNKYGVILESNGTSFSTPRIAAMAESLCYHLGEAYSPLLVKALLVHSATYPVGIGLKDKDLLHNAGFGLPKDADSILLNDENEVTMIFQFELGKGRDIQVVDFPFPESLVSDGKYYGQITVTLAVDPILDSKEGSEYCQSEATIVMDTCEDVEVVTPGDTNIPQYFRNSQRPKNPKNILDVSLYSKRKKGGGAPYYTERQLIKSHMKWATIKKYKVDLEEMTKGNKDKYLSSNRRWIIKIGSHFREAAIKTSLLDGTELKQKAVLVVTIRDPKEKGVAYNECIAQLNSKNFIHGNLSVHQDIVISH